VVRFARTRWLRRPRVVLEVDGEVMTLRKDDRVVSHLTGAYDNPSTS
jgi:hypothetical protein